MSVIEQLCISDIFRVFACDTTTAAAFVVNQL
jgi:hypothetical protein